MPSLTQVTTTGIANSAVTSSQLASSITLTGNLQAANLTITSNANITGTLTVTGNVVANGTTLGGFGPAQAYAWFIS